jgi:hypothetical protein
MYFFLKARKTRPTSASASVSIRVPLRQPTQIKIEKVSTRNVNERKVKGTNFHFLLRGLLYQNYTATIKAAVSTFPDFKSCTVVFQNVMMQRGGSFVKNLLK